MVSPINLQAILSDEKQIGVRAISFKIESDTAIHGCELALWIDKGSVTQNGCSKIQAYAGLLSFL